MKKSLIDSHTFYEEKELGFRPLCTSSDKEISSEEDLDFSDSEVTYETQEAAISNFRKKCTEIKNISLFKGQSYLVEEIARSSQSWNNVKMSKLVYKLNQ